MLFLAIFGYHNPVDDLLQELFKNPLAKQLYDDAQRVHMAFKNRPFTIELVDPSVLHGFQAMANFGSHQIQILKTDPFNKQLSSLIFELTNFLQIQKHYNHCSRLAQGRYPMRRITFIKLREKIEYDGCHIHHQVVRYGIKHLNWDPSMDEFFGATIVTFEEDFKNTPNDHKEFFGQQWDSINGPHKDGIFK